jgi:DNA (cytosine-5)-methyltransferase 1
MVSMMPTHHSRLTVGSLFSGIGGLDLGLERAGMQIVWQVEIDAYARRVLAKHWPDVARFPDVRDVGARHLVPVDLICGGFPCQDISAAGKKAGITGARSGLWKEFYRIICELRPRYVLVENVAALTRRGLPTVLGDLAACGYDAEWQVLSAVAFGAPHRRERLFLVAYSDGAGLALRQVFGEDARAQLAAFKRESSPWWAIEPDVGRMAHGVPHRVDRLRGLGNAVVPHVAEYIGRCLLAREDHRCIEQAQSTDASSSQVFARCNKATSGGLPQRFIVGGAGGPGTQTYREERQV